jgi:hypothetical protein
MYSTKETNGFVSDSMAPVYPFPLMAGHLLWCFGMQPAIGIEYWYFTVSLALLAVKSMFLDGREWQRQVLQDASR